MAQKCAHCGSYNVQTSVDRYTCLDCGQGTSYTTGAVEPADRTEPVDLNEPLVQDYEPEGSPARTPRTPDGVADPGTIIEGMSEAEKWGKPTTPTKDDDRPTSMQTEHSTRNPDLERVTVEETHPDMQRDGGFTT